jgi:hypothetical protein
MNAVEHALRLAVEHTFIGGLCTLTLFAILSPRAVSAEPKGQLYITKDRPASGGQSGRASQYSLGRNAEAVARYEESYRLVQDPHKTRASHRTSRRPRRI